MVAFTGNTVHFAMVAYPATPKDIRGLWTKATELLGVPDETKDTQLMWFLDKTTFATAFYDDEHSMFALGLAIDQ